ncbi:MAG: sporulation integral membrane protein YtvI [Oscillospiraceae bacterium]|nr:sporulation integral membrane protein YtvI [Oscillospiraceae bacterium]
MTETIKAFLTKYLKMWIFLGYAGIIYVAYYALMHWAPYVISLLLPFLMAIFVALITSPLERFFEKKCKIPRTVASVIAWFIALLIFSTVVGFLIYKLIGIIISFAENSAFYTEKIADTAAYWQSLFNTWRGSLPDDIIQNVDAAIISLTGTATSWVTGFAGNILNSVTNWVTAVPIFFITLVVYILASFFMCKDFSLVKRSVAIQFSIKTRERITQIKDSGVKALGRYFRGLSIMILIVYCVLTTGLLILGVNKAWLVAIFIAMMDVFPIVGAGLVLVPWGIFTILITGNWFVGLGLIILSMVNATIRQLIEPKVMSNALGLHPLVTLLAAFIGLKTFGFLGAITFPIFVLVILSLQKAGLFTIWREDEK